MARSATILLVEDDPDDAWLVCKAAQKTLLGIPVFVVPNGQEAVRYLKGEGPYADRRAYPLPDIVLLDLDIPLLNGFEVLRWMREQPRLKRRPVVVLTGSIEDSDAARAYEAGANSYIIKPTDYRQLIETVRNLGDFWLGSALLPEAGPQ